MFLPSGQHEEQHLAGNESESEQTHLITHLLKAGNAQALCVTAGQLVFGHFVHDSEIL